MAVSEPNGVRNDWHFIYAPGAGSNINDPFGRYLCNYLAHRGAQATRFQFPYSEARRPRPDPQRVLEHTWQVVIEAFRPRLGRLVVGGRSMGGRIASQVIAQGIAVDRLVLFAYPLQPPGQPNKVRDEHFPKISVPTLFCSGTRDAFATPEALTKAAAKVPSSTVHRLEGADHGFAVLKSIGRSRENVWEEAASGFWTWLIH